MKYLKTHEGLFGLFNKKAKNNKKIRYSINLDELKDLVESDIEDLKFMPCNDIYYFVDRSSYYKTLYECDSNGSPNFHFLKKTAAPGWGDTWRFGRTPNGIAYCPEEASNPLYTLGDKENYDAKKIFTGIVLRLIRSEEEICNKELQYGTL